MDSTLSALTASTPGTAGLLYTVQGGADRKLSMTAAGATLLEAADAAAQRTALGVVQGARSIFIGAAEMIPRTTTGCGVNSSETTTNKVNYDTLEFDTATQEFAQFIRVLPDNWGAGTVTAKFLWTADSGSGGVVWALAARCFADDDALDTAMGTAQQVADTLITAGDMHITSATAAITLGGTPAVGVPIIFEVKRVPADGDDTLAVDARLLGVTITYT